MQALTKNVVLNVNYFVAKYDFEIGNKIKPNNERRVDTTIKLFNTNCILEILQICSWQLTQDRKSYNSLWLLDGSQVTDLNNLPEDCEVLICSEMPMMDFQRTLLKPRNV